VKIIVAGSRQITDYSIVKNILDHIYQKTKIDAIISGGAKGPDSLGIKWANEYKIPIVLFKPDWNQYGKSAGIRRNIEMSNVADALVAVWDGESRGTKHMISRMKELGKPVYVKELKIEN
jgi:hypothetical protein